MTDSMTVFDRRRVRFHRDRAAAGLAAHDFLLREVADRLNDRLLDISRQFASALDLGCHAGQTADCIDALRSADCTIRCDLSEEMTRRAGGHAVVCDEEFLPFAAGSFDLIVSNLTLHWTNDLPGTLIQARQLLKPDGLLLTALIGEESLCELRDALMQAEIDVTGGVSPRVSPFVTVRDAGALLQRAGFSLPVVDRDRIVVTYDNALKLLTELRGMGETNALSEQVRHFTRRSVLMRTAEIYHERYAAADGRVPATFDIVYLHGWAPHSSQQKPLAPGSATTRLAQALQSEEISAGEAAGPMPAGSSTSRKPD